MALSRKEQAFVKSIKNKISKYEIPITFKEALSNRSGTFVMTNYSDGSTEMIDTGIELFLLRNSFYYFSVNYCFTEVPGLGVIRFKPYYFQAEMAKEISKYRKIILSKTRQCLTEDNYVMTDRGLLSIKEVKTGDKIKTLFEGNIFFTDVEDSFYTGEKEVCVITTETGSSVTCTLDHKVFTKKGWEETQNLSVGDFILSAKISKLYNYNSYSGENISVFEKIVKIRRLEGKQKVYDITTSTSNFLANGLLVHNCGQSTLFSLYSFWRCLFFSSESIDVISLKQTKAAEFNEKFKPTLKLLPVWMRLVTPVNNQTMISFEHDDGSRSSIVSESQSDTAGRSASLSLLIMDEAAFYKSERMISTIISAAAPTLSKTGGQFIMISTPNGTVGSGALYYRNVQEAKQEVDDDTKFLEIDWWEIPDDSRIKGPKKGYNRILKKAISEGYYYKPEVKKKYQEFFKPIAANPESNPWLKASYKDLGEQKYKQEILHEFIVAGDKVLPQETIEALRTRVTPPLYKDKLIVKGKPVEEVNGLWIWKEPLPNHKYSVNCDIASGTSSDYSTIQVLDVNEVEQVAEYKNYISTSLLPYVIRKVAMLYNNAFIVIESNSIGDAVFKDVFYGNGSSVSGYSNMFKQKKTKNGITRYTGWITDVKTRKQITTEVRDWVTVPDMFKIIKLYSSRLLAEFETWIVDGQGKFIHASSCHDDAIMALGLALFNKDKGNGETTVSMMTEDGSFISYSRSDNDENLSSIDENGRTRYATTGGNVGGIRGNDENFSDNSSERALREKYGMDFETYNWLLN